MSQVKQTQTLSRFILQLSQLCVTLALLAGPVISQSVESPSRILKSEYDKFKDKTFVYLDAGFTRLKTPDVGNLSLIAVSSFPGQDRTPQVVDVLFAIKTHSVNARYLESRDITFLIDGQRIALGRTERMVTGVDSDGITENCSITLSRELFERITNASTVEGQLGFTEFELTTTNLEDLRRMLDLLPPKPPGPPQVKKPPLTRHRRTS